MKSVTARTLKDWTKWLEKNHKKEDVVSLILFKRHTKIPSPNNRQAMREAIRFGWIDTTMKRLDDDRYMIRYVKRNKNATWSRNTLRYAKELIDEGKMSVQGLAAYKLGVKKKVIDHDVPKNAPVPAELQKALAKDKVAKKNFDNMAPSYKRAYIVWVSRAKRPETRQKRILEVVVQARKNKKWGQ